MSRERDANLKREIARTRKRERERHAHHTRRSSDRGPRRGCSASATTKESLRLEEESRRKRCARRRTGLRREHNAKRTRELVGRSHEAANSAGCAGQDPTSLGGHFRESIATLRNELRTLQERISRITSSNPSRERVPQPGRHSSFPYIPRSAVPSKLAEMARNIRDTIIHNHVLPLYRGCSARGNLRR